MGPRPWPGLAIPPSPWPRSLLSRTLSTGEVKACLSALQTRGTGNRSTHRSPEISENQTCLQRSLTMQSDQGQGMKVRSPESESQVLCFSRGAKQLLHFSGLGCFNQCKNKNNSTTMGLL